MEQTEYGKGNRLNAACSYTYELDIKGNWPPQTKSLTIV